jgi:hypothetical protein
VTDGQILKASLYWTYLWPRKAANTRAVLVLALLYWDFAVRVAQIADAHPPWDLRRRWSSVSNSSDGNL